MSPPVLTALLPSLFQTSIHPQLMLGKTSGLSPFSSSQSGWFDEEGTLNFVILELEFFLLNLGFIVLFYWLGLCTFSLVSGRFLRFQSQATPL